MGRLLRPVDIAATVGHLLSDASAMMTGTIVDLHPEMASGSVLQDAPPLKNLVVKKSRLKNTSKNLSTFDMPE